ncbi:hypothetical protein H7J88_01585 [Mycolicibacterium flavescens]|uniref:Uncharacterized protein n=1 Tax=Mycolicibacterium flavescens TaxID=1776 RepID=A0A1E3RCQ5_MYCFV|nr:hypothetical protein [Mycolicibacterium flavescens]MCV7278336.1 hypothetical protein [Mycolicibacterium flavescens]ODQ87177.1 hypothetical protein BHQ18_24765 [Mycolicibacterium flavescens]
MDPDSTQFGGGSNPWASTRGAQYPGAAVPFDPGPVGGGPIPSAPPPQRPPPGGVTLNRNHILLIGGVVAVVIVAILGVVMVTGGDEPAIATTPAGSAGQSGSGTDEWAQPTYETPVPVRIVLPPGAVVCSESGSGRFAAAARGNDVTSCPFADAVRDAVRSTGESFPRTVTAYSPVTHKTYSMRCTGDDLITCRGGNDAVVYVY